MKDFGLYVIVTDPDYSVSKITELCVKHHVGMIQLREKDFSDRQLLETLNMMLSITRNSNTKVIINDRLDIALVAGVQGYHLGQDDIPLKMARSIYDDKANLICGLSTHTPAQAEEAMNQNPDYIGFGPIYPTFAKKRPDAAVGCEALKIVVHKATCPVVAIGGINRSNVETVLETGVRNIAMIKAVVKSKNIEEEIAFYSSLLRG